MGSLTPDPIRFTTNLSATKTTTQRCQAILMKPLSPPNSLLPPHHHRLRQRQEETFQGILLSAQDFSIRKLLPKVQGARRFSNGHLPCILLSKTLLQLPG